MSDLPILLSVDDMQTNHELVKFALEDKYCIEVAMDGHAALEKAMAQQPEIILLDINMPEMNGYEVCKKLKEDPASENIPVIFISSLNTLDERMEAYSAGGNDYIIKPFEKDELVHKINLLSEYKKSKESLGDQAKMAFDTAMTAMSNVGEQGTILNFMEATFNAHSMKELAETVFSSLELYSVTGAVQIRVNDTVKSFNQGGGALSPLEEELLLRSKDAMGVVSFGRRSLYNCPSISILIKDMPVDEDEKYGRYKDHLALIMKGAESRVVHLGAMEKLQETQEVQINSALQGLADDLGVVDARLSDFNKHFKQVMEDLADDVEDLMLRLSLTEEQEAIFLKLIDDSTNSMSETEDLNVIIESCFESMTKKIESLRV